MLKNILNLEGVALLDREQQKTVQGGSTGTCGYHYVGWDTHWIDDTAIMVVNPVTNTEYLKKRQFLWQLLMGEDGVVILAQRLLG